MRPVFIDNTVREKIREIIKYGMDNIITVNDPEATVPIAGDDEKRVILIEYGYRVVYSVERNKGRLWRHLSVSINADQKLPSVEAVELLLKEFKFENELEENWKDLTPLGNGYFAVEVVEEMQEETFYGLAL